MECSGSMGKWTGSNKSQIFRPTFLSRSLLKTTTFLITWCCFCSLFTLTSGQSCTPLFEGSQIGSEDNLKVIDKVTTNSENTSPITNVLVVEGIDFNLSCTVSHHNFVKWRLGKTDLLNNDFFTISPTIERPGQLTTHLTARNVSRDLSGVYKCVPGGCHNGSNEGLHIRIIPAERPLIDFQATSPKEVREGQNHTLVVSAIVGKPAKISCITKMLHRSPEWRRKVQTGKEIKWKSMSMDYNCTVKMDKEATEEEKKWLSKRSEENPPKCLILNVTLADESRNLTIFFPILREEDLGEYSCGITNDPTIPEHTKIDAVVTLEAVNVRVKREKPRTNRRDLTQDELTNKSSNKIEATRTFKAYEKSLTVVEGETAVIHCDLNWPGPEERVSIHSPGYHVRWFKDKIPIQYGNDPEANHSITINKTITYVKLRSVNLTDRGMYRCQILDKDDNNITSFDYQVRVRSKMAALWPFIAICVEVVIICLIILIYEKTKSKAEVADSDTDGSPDQKNVSDNNDEAEALRVQEKE